MLIKWNSPFFNCFCMPYLVIFFSAIHTFLDTIMGWYQNGTVVQQLGNVLSAYIALLAIIIRAGGSILYVVRPFWSHSVVQQHA